MNRNHRIMIVLLISLACVGCDQATKTLASRNLISGRSIVVVHELVELRYAENTGAMLGFGAELPEELRFWLFRVLSGVFLSIILVLAISGKSFGWPDIAALSLIMGGGLGNLIDRLFRNGNVVDFVVVTVGTWRTGIFNVADVAIVSGVILLVMARIVAGRKPEGSSNDG